MNPIVPGDYIYTLSTKEKYVSANDFSVLLYLGDYSGSPYFLMVFSTEDSVESEPDIDMSIYSEALLLRHSPADISLLRHRLLSGDMVLNNPYAHLNASADVPMFIFREGLSPDDDSFKDMLDYLYPGDYHYSSLLHFHRFNNPEQAFDAMLEHNRFHAYVDAGHQFRLDDEDYHSTDDLRDYFILASQKLDLHTTAFFPSANPPDVTL